MGMVCLDAWQLRQRKLDCGIWSNWAAAGAGLQQPNLGAARVGLDHQGRIVIELAGSGWCDDDHAFGKSIFCDFGVKSLIFLRFCGMSFMLRDMY
ncbi:hypothetical protein [Anaerobiospirillum succiniciproducens]